MRFSLLSRTIENLGPPFLVAHGNIGNFEIMTKWKYTNVGPESINIRNVGTLMVHHSLVPYTSNDHIPLVPNISPFVFKCLLALMQGLIA